jgi:uroporphyrinogen decarboxylase
MYETYLQPWHQKIIDLSTSFDKPTMLHSCGSVYRMLERFIDMGLSILNPIQPMAKDMQPEKLMAEFGGKIGFHGGIDIQHFLPQATTSEIRQKTRYTSDLLGGNGGYIMSGSHHIQADTPLENVLAMYAPD